VSATHKPDPRSFGVRRAHTEFQAERLARLKCVAIHGGGAAGERCAYESVVAQAPLIRETGAGGKM
jgi:hypothetical protein